MQGFPCKPLYFPCKGLQCRKENGPNNALFLSCQMGPSDGALFMIKLTPLPNGNHPICPMGVADTLGSCCIILVVLRCINSVTEYLLFVKQAGWVQKCKFFDKNLRKQLYFSFNWWQFAKNWRGLIIKCGLGQKWSKLWNQVPYLDHFVVQNSGDFLYWKYKEVVCFYVSNLRQ